MKKRKLLLIFIVSFLLLIFVFNTISYSITVEAFFISGRNFNIRGVGGIKTTYGDGGYYTVLKVGEAETNVINGTGTRDGILCNTELTYISNNNYVKITYSVTNNSGVTKVIGVGTWSDVMIDQNDRATIINLSNNRGFSMTDGTSYTFNFLGRNAYGVTDVDTYWFGPHGQQQTNLWNDQRPEKLENTDSGMAFSWKNRTITPNQTLKFSAVIGIGTLNSPPTITVTSSTKSQYTKNESLSISGKVNDVDSGDTVRVKYSFDDKGENFLNSTYYTPNGTAKSYSGSITIPSNITRGNHTIKVWAVDSQNNMSEAKEIKIFVETDFTNPTASHTLSPSGWTNQNVTITVTGQDPGSGVKRIKLPNETYVNSSQATFEATDNNTYTFVIEDNAGNTLTYNVIVDKIERVKPTVNVTPESCEWSKNISVNINCSDQGGSGFKNYKYAITDQQSVPSSYSEEVSVDTQNLNITDEGSKYLHIIVEDNAGNVSNDSVYGPYKVDHTKPTVQVNGNFEDITTEPIVVNIISQDTLSGLKEISINGTALEVGDGLENRTIQINKNGTYKIKVEDVAGNVYEQDIIVKNINKTCDKSLGHPDFSSDYDSCPICDLITNLEVTNDTVTYNSKEQGVTYRGTDSSIITEYYNNQKVRPIEAENYNYELKVKYNDVEYNTGKKGTFTINPKMITIQNIVAKNRV